MKNYLIFICSGVLIFSHLDGFSQNITTGIYSGVNFSDIHGQDIGGRWKSKPGPVQGLYFGWSFNRSVGIQTGINFSTVYYEHRTTYNPYLFYNNSIYDIGPVYYYPAVDKMDFSFLRVPFLLTVSIPSAVQFNMKAGLVFSFLQDHSYSNYVYYPSSEPDNTKRKDFEYMFSSGISYPLSERFNVSFNLNYITGRKQFEENLNYRHGSTEYTLGINYEFLKKNKIVVNPKSTSDSSSKKVTVTYYAGMNVSSNPGTVDEKKYASITGPLFGFSVNIPLKYGYSIISGVSFERKGYSMKDSSSLFYRYLPNDNHPAYYVDTKVQVDYAIIPILISIPIGKSQKLYLNTGPWLGLKLNARNTGVAYSEYRTQSSYSVRKDVIYDDIEKLIKDNDVGWIFSCGLSLPVVKNYKVDIALQYSTGFKDVFDSSAEGNMQSVYNPDPVIRFNTISLLIGIRIP
jgi:Outer membrane protein beta-barrel domain